MNTPQNVTVENAIRNASSSSTQRVARWRERKRRGVLFLGCVEIMSYDLLVLRRFGCLRSDDPGTVGKEEVETALGSLLDGLARRLGVFTAGSGSSAKSNV
jgi:hypothetical protein